MAKLKYLQLEENFESYYLTLSDVYFYHVSETNSEKEQLQAESTIDVITSLIFHAININGTTIREMDNDLYERDYKRFYNDFMNTIKDCAKNEVDFHVFLEILDDIVSAAALLTKAFDKLEEVKAHEEEEEAEEVEVMDEAEE